jgi:hypothetical protein
LIALLGAACSFEHSRIPEVGVDAPPVTTKVYFVSVTSNVTTIRPGRYGIAVTAVLRNELDVEITDVATALTFGGDRGGQFMFRDADRRDGVMTPQPATVPAGGEATYQFSVDALPWLAPSDAQLNGSATFLASGVPLSAMPAAAPFALPYTGVNAPIVVTTAIDQDNTDAQVSFREALIAAAAASGPDVIVFDPTVLPPDTVIALSETLGALAPITTDVVIDGGDVTLAVDSSWQTPEGRYGLRITAGTVVIANLTFRNFAFNYRNELITTTGGNCGASNTQLEGGAIRVDGGTLILERNRFEDPDVAERNCYAASVRLHGGSGHRILRNRWTQQVMDSIFVAAPTREITDNVMISPANPDRDDEGIYVLAQGGADLWIVGNLIVDQEFSGIVAGGSDGGKLYVINNTLARNGRVSSAGARRQGTRSVTFRNNVYVANNPSAILSDNNGVGLDIAYETIAGGSLCAGTCNSAVIDASSLLMPADPGVENVAGSTRPDFTPLTTSPLVGTGTPFLDRNGGAPGYFSGTGPERGAIELP